MATKKSRRAGGRKSAKSGAKTASGTKPSAKPSAPAGEATPGAIEGKAEEVGRKKKKTSPLEFAAQVRSELSKVTWTTRNEAFISTVMVLIMVAIMSVFFLLVDQSLRFAVCNILPIECVSRDAV
ncbi:MAG: preprotein translocase subunit SecE [Parvularculaceae bacterium]